MWKFKNFSTSKNCKNGSFWRLQKSSKLISRKIRGIEILIFPHCAASMSTFPSKLWSGRIYIWILGTHTLQKKTWSNFFPQKLKEYIEQAWYSLLCISEAELTVWKLRNFAHKFGHTKLLWKVKKLSFRKGQIMGFEGKKGHFIEVVVDIRKFSATNILREINFGTFVKIFRVYTFCKKYCMKY